MHPPDFIQLTLKIAEKQVGIREQTGNRGPQVARFLAAVGLPEGHPWCAAFVVWCIREAAARLQVVNPLPRDARCQKLAEWADARKRLFPTPLPGDIFLLRGPKGIFNHCGFVVELCRSELVTIEGNTNVAGSREGIGVFRRKRKLGDRLRFIRWAD
jgi:hypothetical protein